MSFDPFGDFDTRGYLRNFQKLKEPAEIKRLEHRHFRRNVHHAAAGLGAIEQLSYQDVLDTHRILFQEVYPWAGQDRSVTAPNLLITRGNRLELFAHPQDARTAVDYALKIGQTPEYMAEYPGEVMGYLAHGHPFLDGNGRTIMVVHNELAHRAGISIEWPAVEKQAYLEALTRELLHPNRGELDKFLKPFIGQEISREVATAALVELPGLGPERGKGRGGRGGR